MKKILIILCMILFVSQNGLSKNYAILVMSSEPSTIPSMIYGEISRSIDLETTKYWNDLFLMYEYLVTKADYSSENILTFMGRGFDWNSDNTLSRYKVSEQHPEWLIDQNFSIVDFSNDLSILGSALNDLTTELTPNDNLLIVYIGHGTGYRDNNPDDFYSHIQFYYDVDNDGTGDMPYNADPEAGYSSNFVENQILDIFKFKDQNGNNLYQKRKILFFACHSGCLLNGNQTFINYSLNGQQYSDNENSIIITSAYVDEGSAGWNKWSPHFWSSQYPVISALNGENPIGVQWDYSNSEFLDDNVLSLKELHSEFYSWARNKKGTKFHPQLSDECNRSDYMYITENLTLESSILSLRTEETFRGYWVDKITAKDELIIPENSKVVFAVDKIFHLMPGFKAEEGAYFHAYFGEIPCQNE